MNIIERYISAYVVHCLFPYATSSEEHLDYVFQVLRETGSSPKNPILANVLNLIRQTDPADPNTQREIADYIRELPVAEVKPESEFTAFRHKRGGFISYAIMRKGEAMGFALTRPEKQDECEKEIETIFPDITFQDVE